MPMQIEVTTRFIDHYCVERQPMEDVLPTHPNSEWLEATVSFNCNIIPPVNPVIWPVIISK